jgi:hypothetical protein
MGGKGNKPDFDYAVYDQIFERMAQGESLSGICRRPRMPTRTTVLRHVTSDPAFEALYDRARQAMGDALAEDCLRIADDATNDASDPQAVNRAKLQVDTRKWLASRLFPHRFGGPIAVKQVEDSTPSIRLLLQQALAASEPKVVDVAADEDTTDRFPKTADGRPRLSS